MATSVGLEQQIVYVNVWQKILKLTKITVFQQAILSEKFVWDKKSLLNGMRSLTICFVYVLHCCQYLVLYIKYTETRCTSRKVHFCRSPSSFSFLCGKVQNLCLTSHPKYKMRNKRNDVFHKTKMKVKLEVDFASGFPRFVVFLWAV